MATATKEKPKVASLMIGRAELAQLWDISPKTLDTYRAAGLIGPQPVRLGATLRWNRLEVEAWLLRRTAKGEMLDARTWSGMWKGGRG